MTSPWIMFEDEWCRIPIATSKDLPEGIVFLRDEEGTLTPIGAFTPDERMTIITTADD